MSGTPESPKSRGYARSVSRPIGMCRDGVKIFKRHSVYGLPGTPRSLRGERLHALGGEQPDARPGVCPCTPILMQNFLYPGCVVVLACGGTNARP